MIFVLSQSHGANITTQAIKNISRAGATKATAFRVARLEEKRRAASTSQKISNTGRKPKFSNQNWKKPLFSCIQPGFRCTTPAAPWLGWKSPVTNPTQTVAGSSAQSSRSSAPCRFPPQMIHQPSSAERKRNVCRWKSGMRGVEHHLHPQRHPHRRPLPFVLNQRVAPDREQKQTHREWRKAARAA